MALVEWIHQLAWLVLNLAILAVVKLRWPDSLVGKTLAVIA